MPQVVHTSTLGQRGFGNCLFQWFYAKAYAQKIGATLETPYWTGCAIFEGISATKDFSPHAIDLFDYYQTQDSLIWTRQQAKAWLKFRPNYQAIFEATPKRPIVAHLRYGDYQCNPQRYALIQKSSYVAQAKKLGFNEADIYWVSDGTSTARILDSGDVSFMPDFIRLMRAEILLRGNSTFSWWAAVLGESEVYSPVVGDRTNWLDCEFAKGNWPKMTAGWQDLHLDGC